MRGFGEGVDDYLVKPFAAPELLGRIRAILRRTARLPIVTPRVSEIGGLTLDVHAGDASWQGVSLGLTPTEFAILDVLARAAGRIISRDELTAALHQREATPYERAVDVHVSHLRRKLEAAAQTNALTDSTRPYIRTVRGVGYLYTADPRNENAVPALAHFAGVARDAAGVLRGIRGRVPLDDRTVHRAFDSPLPGPADRRCRGRFGTGWTCRSRDPPRSTRPFAIGHALSDGCQRHRSRFGRGSIGAAARAAAAGSARRAPATRSSWSNRPTMDATA